MFEMWMPSPILRPLTGQCQEFRDVIGRNNFDFVTNDVQNAADLEARGLFFVDEVNRDPTVTAVSFETRRKSTCIVKSRTGSSW
jgi:hypothetical protein